MVLSPLAQSFEYFFHGFSVNWWNKKKRTLRERACQVSLVTRLLIVLGFDSSVKMEAIKKLF